MTRRRRPENDTPNVDPSPDGLYVLDEARYQRLAAAHPLCAEHNEPSTYVGYHCNSRGEIFNDYECPYGCSTLLRDGAQLAQAAAALLEQATVSLADIDTEDVA